MAKHSEELVRKIYLLPKTKEAVSAFLNTPYIEVSKSGRKKERLMWERFEAPYVKVTRHYNDNTDDGGADVYLYAHKLISRCVLAEVAPYFESDGQLFAYFQLMVKNTRINNSVKDQKMSFVLLEGDANLDAPDDELSLMDDFTTSISTVSQTETPQTRQELMEIYSLFDELNTEHDPQLQLFGRLFVNNSFSFDGMYGLGGFSLDEFKALKKRFTALLAKHYDRSK